MKSASPWVLSLFMLFAAACSGDVDGSPDDDQGDSDGGDSHNADQDGDASDGDDDDGDGDAAPSDDDGGGGCEYAGSGDTACPAPALCANQTVVFDDADKNGWNHFSFGSNESVQTGTFCSGTKGYKTDVQQYQGLAFNHGPTVYDLSNVPAEHVSIRVWVSEASAWTVAATPQAAADPNRDTGSKDGHCYRLPLDNCGEGFESICGPDQHAAPCILHWVAGWNIVELDIPPSTGGAIAQLMFELQTDGVVTIVVDDLRLTEP